MKMKQEVSLSLQKNKKIYLFDTFEGFKEESFVTENEKKKASSLENNAFRNTSQNIVLNNMPYKDCCIIMKGLFPETAKLLTEEKFCFVSLDADLYQPTIDGLNYFYPRLVTGGYIMVHDYNNNIWTGGKQAVREYCSKYKINFLFSIIFTQVSKKPFSGRGKS